VCKSSDIFLTTKEVQTYLEAGAKKVVFFAFAKDDSHTTNGPASLLKAGWT